MFTVEFVFFSLLPRKLAVTRAFPQHHWVYILCILCYMIFFFKEKKIEVFSSNSLQYFYMAVVHLSRLSKRSAKILSHCILISFFAHPLQKKKKFKLIQIYKQQISYLIFIYLPNISFFELIYMHRQLIQRNSNGLMNQLRSGL